MTDKTRGAVYIAFGLPYLSMAINSIKTLNQTNPWLPVCIITNIDIKLDQLPFWRSNYDQWKYINDASITNRQYKVAVNRITPFNQTIFIDCDTEIFDSVEPIFFLLDYFDLVITPSKGFGNQPKLGKVLFNWKRSLGEMPYWNSGIFAFSSSSKVDSFFDTWKYFFIKKRLKFDQPSLAEALINSEIRFAGIDYQWNWFKPSWMISKSLQSNIKILHYMFAIDAKIASNIIDAARSLVQIEGKGDNRLQEVYKFITNKRQVRSKKLLREKGHINHSFLSMFLDYLKYKLVKIKQTNRTD